MAAFKIIRKRKAVLPKELVDKETMKTVGQLVEASILENIQKQRTITGGRLKINAPKTRERKRAKGRRQLSLVDEKHRFVKGAGGSWAQRVTGKAVIVTPATPELKALSRWVQLKGYIDWFGVNKIAKEAIRKLMRESIKKQFRKAASRS